MVLMNGWPHSPAPKYTFQHFLWTPLFASTFFDRSPSVSPRYLLHSVARCFLVSLYLYDFVTLSVWTLPTLDQSCRGAVPATTLDFSSVVINSTFSRSWNGFIPPSPLRLPLNPSPS